MSEKPEIHYKICRLDALALTAKSQSYSTNFGQSKMFEKIGAWKNRVDLSGPQREKGKQHKQVMYTEIEYKDV